MRTIAYPAAALVAAYLAIAFVLAEPYWLRDLWSWSIMGRAMFLYFAAGIALFTAVFSRGHD